MKKGLVYYTDNRPDPFILDVVRKQIKKCVDWPIVSVTLKPTDFGKNIVLNLERGYLTMFKQILTGIQNSDADILYFVEHDVLYNPSHFIFEPPKCDVFYYNENRWMVHAKTGHALFYHAMSTSHLCAYKELLLEHYTKRVERVEKEGFTYKLGFEPGNHPYPRGVDYYTRETWFSEFPNIDLRHDKNLTASRWTKDGFRNKSNLWAWTESDSVPYWGRTEGRMSEFLNNL